MIIFGTQGKQRQVEVDPGHVLIFVYRYFHIFWLLRLAYGGRYEVATMTDYGWATHRITAQEAQQMTGPRTPKVSPWDQWSLLGGIVVFIAIGFISSMTH